MSSYRVLQLLAATAAFLSLAGTAAARPADDPVPETESSEWCVAPADAADEEICAAVQIGLAASPNPTPAGGTVSFAWSVSPATDCWDNLGHSAWGNHSFQMVVSEPFTWTVWCTGSGIESSSLGIAVQGGPGPGPGPGDGAVPALISAPSISGTAAVGETLTANRGSWTNSPTTYRYSWRRHGDLLELGTASTLSLNSAHAGYRIGVDVQACNGTGCSAWASSAWTDAVDPFPGGWFYEDGSDESTDARTIQGLGRVNCKTVYYRKTAKSFLFRAVIFRMHHNLRWCWKGNEIVEANAVCYSSDVDAAIQADACSTPQGQYFATSKHVRGGWRSIAQNTYKNCLPIFGNLTCWRQATVTLHIYAYAGGAWSAQGGDS